MPNPPALKQREIQKQQTGGNDKKLKELATPMSASTSDHLVCIRMNKLATSSGNYLAEVSSEMVFRLAKKISDNSEHKRLGETSSVGGSVSVAHLKLLTGGTTTTAAYPFLDPSNSYPASLIIGFIATNHSTPKSIILV